MMGATCGQAIGGILADESFETAFLMCTFVPILSCMCMTGVVMDSPWKDAAPEHVASEQVAPEHMTSEHMASEQVAPEQMASEQVAPEQVAPEQTCSRGHLSI